MRTTPVYVSQTLRRLLGETHAIVQPTEAFLASGTVSVCDTFRATFPVSFIPVGPTSLVCECECERGVRSEGHMCNNKNLRLCFTDLAVFSNRSDHTHP